MIKYIIYYKGNPPTIAQPLGIFMPYSILLPKYRLAGEFLR